MIRRVLCLCVIGVATAACMALPGRQVAVFQEPPLPMKGTIPLIAGLMTLEDARPVDERRAMRDIEKLPERVTLQILIDWKDANLFRQLNHVSEPQGADVILKGELRSFRWKPSYAWLPYIPALGTLAAFGVPVAYSDDAVEIALDVIDPKSGQAIASYTKMAQSHHSYWVYRYQDFTAGDDRQTNSAFRQVADQLQTAMLGDRERMVAAVKPAAR